MDGGGSGHRDERPEDGRSGDGRSGDDDPGGGVPRGRPAPARTGPSGAAAPVVRVVLVGLAVEVLLLVATAVLYLLGTGLGGAASSGLAVGTAVLALALAALLAGCAAGMARGRRRGRVPVLVWQVLQVLVAVQVLLAEVVGTTTWWAALGVAVVGAVVAVSLLSGATTRALPVAPGEDQRLL